MDSTGSYGIAIGSENFLMRSLLCGEIQFSFTTMLENNHSIIHSILQKLGYELFTENAKNSIFISLGTSS